MPRFSAWLPLFPTLVFAWATILLFGRRGLRSAIIQLPNDSIISGLTIGVLRTPVKSESFGSSYSVWAVCGHCSCLWSYCPHWKQTKCNPLYIILRTLLHNLNFASKSFVRSTSTHSLAKFPLIPTEIARSIFSVFPILSPISYLLSPIFHRTAVSKYFIAKSGSLTHMATLSMEMIKIKVSWSNTQIMVRNHPWSSK